MRRIRYALFVSFLVVCTVIAAAAQDGLKGLREYLKQYKYVVFVPPRANATAGSVVNYDAGFETIVSSKCLPPDKVKPSEFSAVGLADREGTLTKNLGIEGAFARGVDPKIDLSGAFKDARVQKIVVQISEPMENYLESNDVKDYIASLAPGSSCLQAFTNKRNRILAGLLRIDSITYKFEDKDGKDISLDLKLLSLIKLSPKYHKDFENKDSMKITQPIFIGYRAWQATKIPGAVRSRVDLNDSTSEEIVDLKATGKRPH